MAKNLRVLSVLLITAFLLAFRPGEGEHLKSVRFNFSRGKRVFLTQPARPWGVFSSKFNMLYTKVSQMKQRGELKLRRVQKEILLGYTHERLDQFFNEMRVVGAQMIIHRKRGIVYSINGRFFEDIKLSNSISISKEKAIRTAIEYLKDSLLNVKKVEKVILPLPDGFRAAYEIDLQHFPSAWRVYVDGESGEVLGVEDRVRYETVIGLGYGVHGDKKKFDAWKFGNIYLSIGKIRPAWIFTYDAKRGWRWGEIKEDGDNIWKLGALVDAHVYAGYVYDFYYKNFGRHGIDDKNMNIESIVRFGPSYNNAFWTGEVMVYGSGDGVFFRPFSAGIDVVAHELSHGVTQFTSDLIYQDEPGALNEAFSDIMATGCEFEFQPKGTGFLKADWWVGEDVFYQFGYIIRSLRSPYREGDDPDHYSIKYTGSEDYGGVHINSTIVSHAFYLLANGGTNRVSKIKVEGIGLEKALKIFYRGFVYYLIPSSDFKDARRATVQAAKDLYGAREVNLVKKAWDAVGVF